MLPSPPSSLVIGDSVIRNVMRNSAVTFGFPGAKVGDLFECIPSLLIKYPLTRNLIVHIGCNDISAQKSEILKRDFTCLFNTLKDCGKVENVCLCLALSLLLGGV